ncbi:MAG: 16S rRNA (adenine(1518)-N(6)/adenine(1519)-N(6))-dimethyltransferase RsmA [Ignavibacteria bacterium]|nr:16S rRNA (adenine(1518)-N(6)/adenine(1519)-N(6))-dimethyltransferase RsmA [Ignavibacteria bacterium]
MTTAKEKFDHYRPKKFLGQNFLVDNNIAKKIVNSLEIKPDDIVLEIGPGQGVLTKYISEITKNFIAVELDKSIYEKLTLEYEGRINLIHKDFLKINLQNDIYNIFSINNPDVRNKKIKVIGNIPYNITTEILFKLFDSSDIIDSAVLMMQKEVAKRLTAQPNTKDYAILAIQTQTNSVPKILFNVPPTAFFPKPRVDSSIVKFDFGNSKYKILYKDIFKTLVKQSFGHRRKTMKNSLKVFFENNEVSFDNIDFDFTRRAESVSIEEYIRLLYDIKELMK